MPRQRRDAYDRDDQRTGGDSTNPQRIVTLHAYTLNALLDVGVVPVGTIEVAGANLLPEYVETAKGIESVGGDEVDYEKIAALKPRPDRGGQVPGVDYGYDKLKEIAPTVMFPMSVPADWQRVALETAAVVGREQEGEAVRQTYLDKAAAIKQTYAEVLGRTKWAAVKESRVYALHHFYPLHYKQGLAVLEQVEGILKAIPSE